MMFRQDAKKSDSTLTTPLRMVAPDTIWAGAVERSGPDHPLNECNRRRTELVARGAKCPF